MARRKAVEADYSNEQTVVVDCVGEQRETAVIDYANDLHEATGTLDKAIWVGGILIDLTNPIATNEQEREAGLAWNADSIVKGVGVLTDYLFQLREELSALEKRLEEHDN